ncbi:MAG: phospho-N-acetylmuramoyl-pentapeptide-transferase [bacterium]|nr:phospho-N-acetylmuramoyl-pentapeptide-transferase [bacterium]
MLYSLLSNLFADIALFRYITFRSAMAAITALTVTFFFGRQIIYLITKLKITESIRKDGPQTHLVKQGTPSMGGIIIILSILSGVLLWADLKNPFIQVMILSTLGFFLLGFTDDIIKLTDKKGVLPLYKILFQFVIAGGICLFMMKSGNYSNLNTFTNLLFIKNLMIDLSIFFLPFVITVIIGTTNSVNITDGLDGLAAGLLAIAFSVFAVIIYISGNRVFSGYLNMMYIPGIGELTLFIMCSAAASLGFLWYNSHPAEIFMGDTGSLTLGGILGTAAVLSKQEVLLFVAGGVFVLEALSSMLQTSYFKLTKRVTGSGKRIFRMAPLHHHFEQMGLKETKIVARFYILGVIFGILALSTLKIR